MKIAASSFTLFACLTLAACGGGEDEPATAVPADFFGQWDVNTKLTTASDPTNPDYEVGDIRIDVWTFAGSEQSLSLTTKDGTITGSATGSNASFETMIDTGMNLKMKVIINCALTSSRSMKGTIKAEYYGTFDNYIGLDAWTFEAIKR